ncbi:STAG domain-containing protein [Verticillium dahliae]
MDNATASPEPESASRCRSGRVVRAPEKFSPEPALTTKRKRTADHDDENSEDDDGNSEEDASDDARDMSDATDDQPTPRPKDKQKQQQRKPAPKPAKPSAVDGRATKKPKTNGLPSAALTKASSLPTRPKKTVAIADFGKPGQDDLYADVFTPGRSSDDAADDWFKRYREDDAGALRDLVNFVLQVCGCEHKITDDDIRDPDNSDNRLGELQELYQEERITEYPLISRAKGIRSFRELFGEFFEALVTTLHETEVLYKEPVLMENISRWIASMSSSPLRPFRHTATTAILSIVSGLVDTAVLLDKRISTIEHQISASQRQKNKTKVAEMQQSLEQANAYRAICNDQMKDFFETTFVHRYRDVDPRIRTECAEALGIWVQDLPSVFMEPGHLRYLGWMLSDVVASTRQEVLKQLGRIFKTGVEQLGHFVDRFRPRLIEIATKDAEVSVRVAAIGVADTLRKDGMLEPDEVDAVGRLIFDSELRVRKAAATFFDNLVSASLDDQRNALGGKDAIEEALGGSDELGYESPQEEWLHIKLLAENIVAFDAQVENELGSPDFHDASVAADIMRAVAPATRISVAAHVLYERIQVVRDWKLLAGYLLYDHTVSSKSKSKAKNSQTAIKNLIRPDDSEEAALLEVMAAAVTLALSQPVDAKRSGRHENSDAQEETALELAAMIPRLLNKFGADPSTAKIVLRMEHALKLDVFQQLRQDSSRYEHLLDEISIQFNRHGDKDVLAEATAALSHARQHDELEELTDSKLALLWENAINSLRNFDKTCEIGDRGDLTAEHLTDLSTVVNKISNLASVADCVDVMEAEGRSADSEASPIEILASIVNRGTFVAIDDDIDELEDELVSWAIKACQFYFMWKLHRIEKLVRTGSDMSSEEVDQLQKVRGIFQDNLINTLSSRVIIDDIRLYATGSLCDMYTLFASLRDWTEAAGKPTKYKKLANSVGEVVPALVPELISIFDGIERSYARRTKRVLNEPADDEDPIDDDESDDEDEDEGLTKEQRFVNELKAERSLCELAAKFVMAIARQVIDKSGPNAGRLRRRLLRNQSKLGKNYAEVVAYLDEAKVDALLYGRKSKASKTAATAAAAAKKAGPASKKPTAALSEEIVVDDEEPEDPFEEEPEPEEGSREDLRRRELLSAEDDEPEDEKGDDDRSANAESEVDSVLGD